MLRYFLWAPFHGVPAVIVLSICFLAHSVHAQEGQASKFRLSGYRNLDELKGFITKYPESSHIVYLIEDPYVTYDEAKEIAIRLREMKSPHSIPVQLAMFNKLYSIRSVENHITTFPEVKDSAAKYSLQFGGEDWLEMFGNNEYTDSVVIKYLDPRYLDAKKFEFLAKKRIRSRHINAMVDTLLMTVKQKYDVFDGLANLAKMFPEKQPAIERRALELATDNHWREKFITAFSGSQYVDTVRQAIRMELVQKINNTTRIRDLRDIMLKDSTLYDVAEVRAVALINNYRDCISYEDSFPDGANYDQVKNKYMAYIKEVRKEIETSLRQYEDRCNRMEKTILGWGKNSLNARNDLNDFLGDVDPLDKFLDQHSDVFTETQSDRYSRIHNRLRDFNTRAKIYIRN